ncbi:hypothetical protein KGP17_17525 [Serratia sp. JSRIV001]|uniref:hypothetical protein n=1 Tax=Serratia sp. JSRIV001 TaxID=2831893 RepID=UPI001CBF7BBF|nr:hypothetical protein [Serratia sp. JSRIV001]UAN44253.1 hypothetical protein KGP17_17525 [Serratia sp. JSRIV001]
MTNKTKIEIEIENEFKDSKDLSIKINYATYRVIGAISYTITADGETIERVYNRQDELVTDQDRLASARAFWN